MAVGGFASTPTSTAPAVLVLNAFDAGGAQLAGSRGSSIVSIGNDLDIATGRHAIRAGAQLDAGRYRTSELRNTGGTFTFASLAAYAAGQPTTFTRNLGNPDVDIAQAQLGLYVQDDIRARKDLTDQRRPAAGISVAHRRLQPGAARRLGLVAVQERQDDDPRRRRHLLRLVRRPVLRTGRAA